MHPYVVAVPNHHHLPGWVRRVHSQASPILGDIIGGLEGDVRDRVIESVEVLQAGISNGKFSLAWHYPRLIEDGMKVFEEHRRESAEVQRQRRQLELQRRKVSDMIRDGGTRLAPDVAARLNRELRAATAPEALRALELEVTNSLATARSADDRRREREIDRTRARIQRSTPRGVPDAPQETWQDVLRRFAEQQSGDSDNA